MPGRRRCVPANTNVLDASSGIPDARSPHPPPGSRWTRPSRIRPSGGVSARALRIFAKNMNAMRHFRYESCAGRPIVTPGSALPRPERCRSGWTTAFPELQGLPEARGESGVFSSARVSKTVEVSKRSNLHAAPGPVGIPMQASMAEFSGQEIAPFHPWDSLPARAVPICDSLSDAGRGWSAKAWGTRRRVIAGVHCMSPPGSSGTVASPGSQPGRFRPV